MIFFAREGDLRTLNKAVQYASSISFTSRYILENELSSKLKIVHVYESRDKIPPALADNVAILDEMYPKIRIDLVRCLTIT